MNEQQLQTTYRRQAYLLLAAAWGAALLIHYHNLFRPFWHDELISLHYFQLVPFRTTITDYGDVNNHIGFNLLCNIYLKLTGQHDFLTLLYHPERLRILLLLITCGTVWAVWKLSLEIAGLRLALINLVLLLTTLPFYNFTMQLRGYGLCILLVLVWMRYVYRYCVSGGWRNLLGIGVLLTALLYTHPGNIFLVAAMFPSTLLLASGRAPWFRFLAGLWTAMAAGLALGLLLYLPMLHTLFHNPQVGLVEGGYQAGFFYRIFGANTYFFLSARYPALLAALVGAGLVGRRWQRGGLPVQVVFWGFCIVLYTAAYIVAFLRRDDVFVRIFVPGAGLFVVALGMGVHWCLERACRYRVVLTSAIAGSCLLIFPGQIHHRNQVVDAANAQGVLCNNLYYTYFAHGFQPFRLTDLIRERSREPGFLLFCISQYKRDATEVLDALHIPYHLAHEPGEVQRLTAGHDHWYLMTMRDLTYFKQTYPRWRFELVNSEPYFNNLYRVTQP